MRSENHTMYLDFILVGFSNFPSFQTSFILLFVFSYMTTLISNLLLITLIYTSPLQESPMYFFLSNLAWLDILYTSVTSPKLINIFIISSSTISLSGCITQYTFFVAFTATEYFLLTVMSYDRYVAVCRPLRYYVVLSRRFCRVTSMCVWLSGFVTCIPIAVATSQNVYCSSNVINHFFCDIAVLLELSCTSTVITQVTIFIEGFLFLTTCFLPTVISYILIIKTVSRVTSTKGKYKAFSTCTSHLTTVSLFYSVILVLYMVPRSAITLNQRKIMGFIYSNVIPMLNPLVYSLRNKDVKRALVHVMRKSAIRLFIK